MPLVDRIHELKIPVTFVCAYPSCPSGVRADPPADGDTDWMDPQGGVECVEKLRQAGNKKGKMYIVKHAGHHGKRHHGQPSTSLTRTPVYLDNPSAVNKLLSQELDST
jgi:cardiolipin-specific phospholipase